MQITTIKKDGDEIIVEEDIQIETTDNDIAATSNITLPQTSITSTAINLGANTSLQQNTSTNDSNINNETTELQAKQQSSSASGGKITTQNAEKLPNIFFSFRSRPAINTSELLFKFETSSLVAGDFTGNKLSSWISKSELGVSPITLQANGAETPLKVVKAYGKFFYELDRVTSSFPNHIQAIVNLPIKTNPSYTILVYAVGRENITGVISLPLQINRVHLFCKNSNTYKNNINIGDLGIYKPTLGGKDPGINTFIPTASFVGNTLNSEEYSQANSVQRASYNKYVNITDRSFAVKDPLRSFFNVQIPGDSSIQKYYGLDFSNISKLRNDINNPQNDIDFVLNTHSAPGTTQNISLKQFSLYFVEMFSYIEGNTAGNKTLKLQTFVNGLLTYNGSMSLSNTIPIGSSGDFLIRLRNSFEGFPVTSANDKLFLFDYMHGISSSSAETMKKTSKNIVESLAYDYRNIILKSETDLKICDSDSGKILGFSPTLAHPFLRFFSTPSAS